MGLVAAYSFDEGTGVTVADASGNGNTGTIVNATWTGAGKYGNALVFNGTNANVTVPDSASLHLTMGMTLEAWVNPSAVTSDWRDVIYKGNDNYYLEGTSGAGGAPGCDCDTSGPGPLYGSTPLPVNVWSHLAATYDASTLKLYVNGVQVSSRAQTGSIPVSTNPLEIGGDHLYGQYFQGMIDEVRVYNVALTQAQIQSDMTTPISLDTQPPTVPTNLTGQPVSSSEIDLSWSPSTDNVGVTSYVIERQSPGSSTWVQIGIVTGTPPSTTYKDTNFP